MAYRVEVLAYHGIWLIYAISVTHIIHFPFWLGDFVMALPVAHAWCKGHANERCIAVIDPSLETLLKRSGLAVEIWVMAKSDRRELFRKLKAEQIQSVLMLTNSVGSMLPYWRAGVKKRLGFGGPWTRWLLTERGDRKLLQIPQGERWFQLLGLPNESSHTPFLISRKPAESSTRQLLVFPGAKYGPAKQWSTEALAQLITRFQAKNWEVYLLGTAAEKRDADAIQSKLQSPVHDCCGNMGMGALLDFLEGLDHPRVLANDSGAMHLLAACGLPTVGLYFSTSSTNTPPAFGPAKVLEADIVCRPCYGRTCVLQHYQCRDKITVDQVEEALLSF